MAEYQSICEFSYNKKLEQFVIRFLSGESYVLPVSDLPKKLQSKKPKWEEAYISDSRESIMVLAGNDLREIEAHIIHSRGKLI